MSNYYLAKLTFELTLCAPAHFGFGERIPTLTEQRNNDDIKSENRNATLRHIPSSTLKGLLREQAEARSLNDFDKLLGKAEVHASNLCIQNAYPTSEHTLTPEIRTGIRINPVTLTTEDGALYETELIPQGTCFQSIITAKNVSLADIQALKQLIEHSLDGSFASALGAGKSLGWGLVKAGKVKARGITTAQLATWFEGTENIEDCYTDITRELIETKAETKALDFTFQLNPSAPLLINDPNLVSGKKMMPVAEFMRKDGKNGKAIIPSSTLRGALRAQAHKVMATIAHLHYGAELTQAHDDVSPQIEQFFGGEQNSALMQLADAIDTQTNTIHHAQTFIAIDRFTGGVQEGANNNSTDTTKKKGALYSVNAAQCAALIGTGRFIKELTNWQKGLLLLVVRDFMEGDLVLGSGKSKGYGQMTLSIAYNSDEYTNFNTIIQALGKETVQSWLEDLHTEIQSLYPDNKNTTTNGAQHG